MKQVSHWWPDRAVYGGRVVVFRRACPATPFSLCSMNHKAILRTVENLCESESPVLLFFSSSLFLLSYPSNHFSLIIFYCTSSLIPLILALTSAWAVAKKKLYFFCFFVINTKRLSRHHYSASNPCLLMIRILSTCSFFHLSHDAFYDYLVFFFTASL